MHEFLIRSGKIIVTLAAAWAVGASLYIYTVPVSVHGVTGVVLPGASTVLETTTNEYSWHEVQGLWGTLWLVFFSGLHLVAIQVAWRGNYVGLAIISVIAVALSIVTGFSIGGAYLPAAIGLFTASLLLLSSRLMRARC